MNIRFITAPLVVLLCALSFSPRGHSAEASAAEVKIQLQTYFFDAARAGHMPALQEFIAAGYDLNSQDAKGYTALILAAYHGHADAVNKLLQAGADACMEDARGNTALMGAIFKGELGIARKLVQTDCAPDQRNAAGQTPAMYAALFGRIELLDDLQKKGADLNRTDIAGNSAVSLLRGEIKTGTPTR